MDKIITDELIDYAWTIARIPRSEYIDEDAQKLLFKTTVERIAEMAFSRGFDDGKIN